MWHPQAGRLANTYDVLALAAVAHHGRVERIAITSFYGSTYHADVHLVRTLMKPAAVAAAQAALPLAMEAAETDLMVVEGTVPGSNVIDARPSDAINLALTFGAPIWVRRDILQAQGDA